ncbi:MAG: alpha/beta fold hydrolase [Acidimicrobiaceae bacterium]
MSLLSIQKSGSGEPILWLHGFTQTRDSAHIFRYILAGTNEVLTVDLPGHGSASDVTASLNETADLIAEILPPEPIALGGYSMGGRIALHVALQHPGRISKLILLSATRGIGDKVEREERRERDDDLAERIISLGSEEFTEEWLAKPMFASLPFDPAERTARSTDAQGMANSLRSAGTGTQEFLSPRLGEIEVPTLCIAGSLDKKFVGEANHLAQRIKNGSLEVVEDAGHAVHLEKPEEVAKLVANFLNEEL